MGTSLTSAAGGASVPTEEMISEERRKRDKLTRTVRRVAAIDTALAIFQVFYAQFRLLRPDHPLGRDVFSQFMAQSLIFPLILFTLIAFQGVVAIRMYFAAKLVEKPETKAQGLNRCRWWCYGSVLFIILSLLDLFTITYLLAFDAYKRFSTIFLLMIINLMEISFRIFGLFVVRKLLLYFQSVHSPLL